MWWENFHSPQDDDQKWTGCSMLLTSWVPCCNQQASDGGWPLPSIFPHWLHIWIFHWNYSYSCSAFLKVMCSSWVTTGITAVILVPGGLFPLATSLAGTWRALQDPLSSNWGEEIPLIIIAKCSWRLMLLHINVVTELCWAWGQVLICQFRRPISVNLCCVRTCPQVCCSIVVVCVMSWPFSQLLPAVEVKEVTSAACCWHVPSGCRVLSLWLPVDW